MSGSDSSGLGSFGPSSSCDFDVEVNLASPDRTVSVTLQKGEVLSLVLEQDPAGYDTLRFRTADGRIVSGLAYPGFARLITCIKEGHEYIGTVKEIGPGGSGTAQLRNKP